MSSNLVSRPGGQILVDQLLVHGADLAFGVPGESYLAVLDGVYERRDAFKFVICRHEAAAANMAEAYGKLTGRPGICMVTRGPGATHGATGLHTAFQDSTPMIMLIGQVGRDMAEREAFQEIDYRRMFGPVAKWVAQIDTPERIPEFIGRAFATATSGRPGPVVLALPEDMLREMASVPDGRPLNTVQAHPGAEDLVRVRAMLEKAERPLLMVGGGTWNAQAKRDIETFSTAWNLPITVSFRCQDYVDNTIETYAGDVGVAINPKLAARVRESDLLLVVGPRLGEMTTSGYTLIDSPVPRQSLIHVHPGAEELHRVYQADLAINSGLTHFAAALAAMPAPSSCRWADWTKAARADYQAYQVPPAVPGEVDMGQIMLHLREVLPADAIITNGAGNYATWVHRYYRWRAWRTQLAPTSGAMGYGVPAAVSAAIAHPGRMVVSFAGDGCFMMNGQEIATALQYDAKPIIIVVNNGMYGTIRMHQERHYPERISGTYLRNPDFAAYARAFGAHGETVLKTADFPAAFERAKASGTAAVIELRVDPEALTPGRSLSAIRAEGKAQQGR